MLTELTIKATIKNLPIELLTRGKYQPRQHFDNTALQELANSIKQVGEILQPLIVRPKSNGRYEIIAGERRWRAAQLIGLEKVPCSVGHYTDEEALQIALIENTARRNLNPIEEAEGMDRLIKEFQYTHEQVAQALGKSRTEVTNLLRLLKLDPKVKTLIIESDLSESHGKILAGVPVEQQYHYAREAAARKWSTREMEEAILRDRKKRLPLANGQPMKATDIQRLERRLSDYLGSSIKINMNAKHKGFVKIPIDNLEVFQGLLERIGYCDDD